MCALYSVKSHPHTSQIFGEKRERKNEMGPQSKQGATVARKNSPRYKITVVFLNFLFI